MNPTPRDAAALALLTPRQREAIQLMHRGHSTAEVAARMDTTINHVTVLISMARKRIAKEAVASGITCERGHLQTHPWRQGCKTCTKEDRSAAKLRRPASLSRRIDDLARDSISADIAAGKRCPRCWLLSPCADHEGRRVGR